MQKGRRFFFSRPGEGTARQPQAPRSEFESPLVAGNAVGAARAPRPDGDQEYRGASKVPRSGSQL